MTYHPAVNFAFFGAVIIFAVVVFHPVCSLISLTGALSYAVSLNGKKALKFFCKVPLLIMTLIFIMNPLFVHKGVSVLMMIGDTQITKEAFAYGACSALMTGSVIMWFYCYGLVMTSDRFMAVFGRHAPATSLVFSMVLRFIPRLTVQAHRTREAQWGFFTEGNGNMTVDHIKTSLGGRIHQGIEHTSILTTWALENSIETADSMRSRGYGISTQRGMKRSIRTNYSGYKIHSKDSLMLCVLALISTAVIWAKASGTLYFTAYPVIVSAKLTGRLVAAVVIYTIFCCLPAMLAAHETLLWKIYDKRS
jgi:energy-coupling factor transport system permease protein